MSGQHPGTGADDPDDRIERLRTLVEANLALSGELRPDVLLQTLVDLARRVGGARYAALGVLDDAGRGLASFTHSGMPADVVETIGRLPEGRGVLGAVIEARRPLRLHDLAEHPASVGFPEGHPPMRTFLGVPVEYHGEVFGNLYLTDKVGGDDFTEVDERVVRALAAQAAVAIENARAYRREQDLVDELRVLDEARSDFVSTVSHELRSPVTALSGLARTLHRHRSLMTDDEVAESLEAIDRQADRLNRLVQQLLDLSRIESSQFRVDCRAVSLRPLVDQAIEVAVAADALEVRNRVPDHLQVHADPDRLDQVLVNLVGNARRHGGPTVVVDAGPGADATVELVVSDDGDGVPDHVLPRLFQRFARGRSPEGSGLGLAISAALVEAMQGTLRYERADGTTRFVVTLPAPA